MWSSEKHTNSQIWQLRFSFIPSFPDPSENCWSGLNLPSEIISLILNGWFFRFLGNWQSNQLPSVKVLITHTRWQYYTWFDLTLGSVKRKLLNTPKRNSRLCAWGLLATKGNILFIFKAHLDLLKFFSFRNYGQRNFGKSKTLVLFSNILFSRR